MKPVRLSVKHIRQKQDGECIAACAAMTLDYLGLSVDYDKLVRLLNIRWDEIYIFVNDPGQPFAPITISHGNFDLAWLERDEYYATFMKREG
jgi:hypothetical protein